MQQKRLDRVGLVGWLSPFFFFHFTILKRASFSVSIGHPSGGHGNEHDFFFFFSFSYLFLSHSSDWQPQLCHLSMYCYVSLLVFLGSAFACTFWLIRDGSMEATRII